MPLLVERFGELIVLTMMALVLVGMTSCSPEFYGGGAVGAAGASAAYEVQAKRQLDQLNRDYEGGKMTAQEYELRKDQVRRGSLIY